MGGTRAGVGGQGLDSALVRGRLHADESRQAGVLSGFFCWVMMLMMMMMMMMGHDADADADAAFPA